MSGLITLISMFNGKIYVREENYHIVIDKAVDID